MVRSKTIPLLLLSILLFASNAHAGVAVRCKYTGNRPKVLLDSKTQPAFPDTTKALTHSFAVVLKNITDSCRRDYQYSNGRVVDLNISVRRAPPPALDDSTRGSLATSNYSYGKADGVEPEYFSASGTATYCCE